MRFDPRRWPGILVGTVLLITLLAADIWIGLYLARRSPDLISFLVGLAGLLTLPLLALLAYGIYGLISLTYDINRDRLLIRWAAVEHVVPLGHITHVVQGGRLSGSIRWRGMRWPGHVVGRGETQQWGPLVSFATAPLSRQLLLVTPSRAYGISPAKPQEFLAGLEVRRQMGALRALPEEVRLAPLATWRVWHDRTLWGLALAGALANALLFGYLCWRYASLPSFLPLHFDSLGQVDRIGERSELFRLPVIGLLALAVDATVAVILPSWLRPAGYLLVGGAIVVQALLGVALWALMR
jgi:hypothetical protein